MSGQSDVWVVRVEWADKRRSWHGLFWSAAEAERWAWTELGRDVACVRWDLVVLSR
jgi:hypothetical protein